MTDHLIVIRPANADDVPLIRQFIAELADYERLADAAVATDDDLRAALFGAQPAAEVLIGEVDGAAAGFALFFHNFSTFLGKRGLYLEDLFVRPQSRCTASRASAAIKCLPNPAPRNCGRFEWSVLDWNTPAIAFYRSIGAVGMQEWTVQRLEGDALRALAAHDEL